MQSATALVCMSYEEKQRYKEWTISELVESKREANRSMDGWIHACLKWKWEIWWQVTQKTKVYGEYWLSWVQRRDPLPEMTETDTKRNCQKRRLDQELYKRLQPTAMFERLELCIAVLKSPYIKGGHTTVVESWKKGCLRVHICVWLFSLAHTRSATQVFVNIEMRLSKRLLPSYF